MVVKDLNFRMQRLFLLFLFLRQTMLFNSHEQ